MQKRHFQLIAQVIASLPETATREQIAQAFARALMTTNGRFDIDRFINACTK